MGKDMEEPSIWVHNAVASALEKGGQLESLLLLLEGWGSYLGELYIGGTIG